MMPPRTGTPRSSGSYWPRILAPRWITEMRRRGPGPSTNSGGSPLFVLPQVISLPAWQPIGAGSAACGLTRESHQSGRVHDCVLTDPCPLSCPPGLQNDSTALHWASERGHFDCVRLLLNAGANIEISNKARTSRSIQRAWRKRLHACTLASFLPSPRPTFRRPLPSFVRFSAANVPAPAVRCYVRNGRCHRAAPL